MSTFKAGDVAIIHGLIIDPELNGSESLILSAPQWLNTYNEKLGRTSLAVRVKVRLPCGDEVAIKPANLRKRRPPSTDESESRQAMLDCIERARRPVMEPA